MIENLTWELNPPYGFYFRVSFFQMETGKFFTTSFSDVAGLGWNAEKNEKKDSEGKVQVMENGIKCNSIILTSPLQPLPSLFEQWVNDHFDRMAATNGKSAIDAYDMVVSLQNRINVPIAAWLCSHVYPVSLSVDGISSTNNNLATEKITLTCNRIERKL